MLPPSSFPARMERLFRSRLVHRKNAHRLVSTFATWDAICAVTVMLFQNGMERRLLVLNSLLLVPRSRLSNRRCPIFLYTAHSMAVPCERSTANPHSAAQDATARAEEPGNRSFAMHFLYPGSSHRTQTPRSTAESAALRDASSPDT